MICATDPHITNVGIRQPAHAAPLQRPSRPPRPRPGAPVELRCPAAARGNIAPPGTVEVAGQHVEHVDEPARERAELLRRRAEARHRPPRARRPRARAPSRRISPGRGPHRRGATAFGREAASPAPRASSPSPSTCSVRRPGISSRPSSTRVAADSEQQLRVGSGTDEVMLVGVLGGAGAARIDHHDLAAALPDPLASGRNVRRGHQAAVRDQGFAPSISR